MMSRNLEAAPLENFLERRTSGGPESLKYLSAGKHFNSNQLRTVWRVEDIVSRQHLLVSLGGCIAQQSADNISDAGKCCDGTTSIGGSDCSFERRCPEDLAIALRSVLPRVIPICKGRKNRHPRVGPGASC